MKWSLHRLTQRVRVMEDRRERKMRVDDWTKLMIGVGVGLLLAVVILLATGCSAAPVRPPPPGNMQMPAGYELVPLGECEWMWVNEGAGRE